MTPNLDIFTSKFRTMTPQLNNREKDWGLIQTKPCPRQPVNIKAEVWLAVTVARLALDSILYSLWSMEQIL